MSELPPPPGRISGNGGLREPSPLLFSDFDPKEHTLKRVPEEEDEEEEENEKKEIRINYEKTSSSDYFMEYNEREQRRCSSCFRMCCACTCLILSLLLLFLLILGVSLATSVNSSLPLVSVVNLRFPKMEFNGSSTGLVLNADVITVLQFSNQNDKTVLYYSPMIADVSSDNIDLGQTKLEGFRQDPADVKTQKIITKVRKYSVYDVDATLLKNRLKNFEAVVDVILSGEMGLDFWGIRIHLPVVFACEDVNQKDVIQGLKPKCDVRIFDKR